MAASDAERQRRARARRRRNEIVVPTPVCGQVLDVLVALHWLEDSDATDRTAVGNAISAMLSDMAQHK